jgi:hypothetical protein
MAATSVPLVRFRPFRWDDLDAHSRLYADPEVTGFLGTGTGPADRIRERSRHVLEDFIGYWARPRQHGSIVGACFATSGAVDWSAVSVGAHRPSRGDPLYAVRARKA